MYFDICDALKMNIIIIDFALMRAVLVQNDEINDILSVVEIDV